MPGILHLSHGMSVFADPHILDPRNASLNPMPGTRLGIERSSGATLRYHRGGLNRTSTYDVGRACESLELGRGE